jgi:hypothetical protein
MAPRRTLAAIAIILIPIGVLAALPQATEDPPTELYVRTTPAGATLFLDGKKLGTAPDIFEVAPAKHELLAVMHGYKSARRDIDVPATRIERVILTLEKLTPSVDIGNGSTRETKTWEQIEELLIRPLPGDSLDEMPLGEMVLDFAGVFGVNVVLDRQSLTKARVSPYTRITLQRGESTFEEALRQLGLEYEIERGMIIVRAVKTFFLPDVETPDVDVVLDLASGEMLPIADPSEFARQGKGDLVYDDAQGESVACLRGATAAIWDGNRARPVAPLHKIGDVSVYGLPPVPYRLGFTPAEGPEFDTPILYSAKSQQNDEGIPRSVSGIRLKYKLIEAAEADRTPNDSSTSETAMAGHNHEHLAGQAVKTFFLPDVETPEVDAVLDLASGEMLPIEDPSQFARLGKGDLFYDDAHGGSLAFVRGAETANWDGPPHSLTTKRPYKLQPLPYRVLIRTAEDKVFDVTILSAGNAGRNDEGIPPHVSGIRLTYRLGAPTIVPRIPVDAVEEVKRADGSELPEKLQDVDPDDAEETAASMDNLKKIGLGMHAYAADRGSLPHAASYGADGEPLLSWRVHILPYLEKQALYEQFHLDESWDSPNNVKLLPKMPELYRVPAARKSDKHQSSYYVITGPHTLFVGKKDTETTGIRDGAYILAVEADLDVPWTKPHDIPYDDTKPLPKLGGFSKGGFSALMNDASVRWIREGTEERTLRTLIRGDEEMKAHEHPPTLQQVIEAFRHNESLIADMKGSFRLTTRNAGLANVLIRSKVSSMQGAGKKVLEQEESELSDLERHNLQSDLDTLSQADPGYESSYSFSFQWAASGDKRWFRRDLGIADGVPQSEEIVFDGRQTYWNRIGYDGATVWDGWISDRWPLPDDCGIAVSAVPMSEFLTRNSERCTQPMSGEYKGRLVYLVEVQGLPETSQPKDWTKKQALTKKQLKLRLWLDPDNRLMPVKIEQGDIVHLPVGTTHESFPHYVIEPLELLATENGAWLAKRTRFTQLAAWPWSLTQADREQVLTETVLEASDLVINQGLPDKLFQTRLSPDAVVTDMSTGESLPHSGVLPPDNDNSKEAGD